MNKDGSITEKDILPVNLALDHRYFDGAGGAKVLREVCSIFSLYVMLYANHKVMF